VTPWLSFNFRVTPSEIFRFCIFEAIAVTVAKTPSRRSCSEGEVTTSSPDQ
jgi:hypothetical protein